VLSACPDLEVVHDLHLPPHIINVLLAPAQQKAAQGGPTQPQLAPQLGTPACATEGSKVPGIAALPGLRQLALGDGLASKLLGGSLKLCHARGAKLAPP
jgi:hypothetical protein